MFVYIVLLQFFIMKSNRFKYYDYLLLWFMAYIWITTFYLPTICGMEQHKGDAITSFGAAATAMAINPTRNERPGSSGQRTSKGYSEVVFQHIFLHEKSSYSK